MITLEITYNILEIEKVAETIWLQFNQEKVWLFNAQMGCGKTTFINALSKYLKVKETSSSPTFSIINEYKSEVVGAIYHLDLYRLKDAEEAINAGVEDVLYSNNYCFVEWPEKATEILPTQYCNVSIQLIDEQTRIIKVTTLH